MAGSPKKAKKCCLGGSPGDYDTSSSDDSDTDSDVEKAKSQMERRSARREKKSVASPTEDRCCSDLHCCMLLVGYTGILLYLFCLCADFHDLLEPRDKYGYKCKSNEVLWCADGITSQDCYCIFKQNYGGLLANNNDPSQDGAIKLYDKMYEEAKTTPIADVNEQRRR